jgi:Zn-dependent M28 family amino/carboxypeptidase
VLSQADRDGSRLPVWRTGNVGQQIGDVRKLSVDFEIASVNLAVLHKSGCGVRMAIKRMDKLGAIALAAAFPGTSAEAEDFSLRRLQSDTQILSSDAFEGRAPLTPGEQKAVAFIASTMREIGLRPGAGNSFLQPVPIIRTRTLTDPVPHFSVVGSSGRAEFKYQQEVTLNTGLGTSSVELLRSPIVFVGFGITAPERGWDDYAGVDVRGKTVLILVNDPDWRNAASKGPFGGKAMTYYGRYDYKFEEAARQGAAAAILIHSDASAGYPFSVPASSLAAATAALDSSDRSSSGLLVQSWIAHGAAATLVGLGGTSLDDLETAAAAPGFRARELDVRANISFKVRSTRGVSNNVIGLLPGTERPDEYLLYTAHWDHLGRCPPDSIGDDICNGAIDNAVGVAGLLELARAFRREPPKRSILFLATTGEEQGFLGSRHYVENPIYPLAKTVAQIDMDPLNFMLGATRDISLIADQTELAETVRRVAASQNRTVTPDTAPEQGNRYRSDTLSFSRAGVPVVLVGVGSDVIGKPRGWGQQQLDRYYELHYHQPSDAYDPKWDWTGALQDLEFFYRVGDRLAETRAWPNWYPHDEFRRARDAVLAAAGK